MIPKIIHSCWFGGRKKPGKIKHCMRSWREKLPEYQFIEWTEENFDVYGQPYVRQAYEQKKYAFVSDVARIRALWQYGGLYLDTDVWVYRSFEELRDHHCIFGMEYGNWVATSFMAAEARHPVFAEFAREYEGGTFLGTDGVMDTTTNVQRLTGILQKRGLLRENVLQRLEEGIVVYPREAFSPYDYVHCCMEKTENTYCSHLFYVSWLSGRERWKQRGKRVVSAVFGKKALQYWRERRGADGEKSDQYHRPRL